MEQNASKPKVNPIVRALTALTTDEPNVQLSGFVGKALNGFIRIYFSLDMSTYADVPEDDLIYFIESEKDDLPSNLFVRASSDIKVTVRRTFSTQARDLATQVSSKCCGSEGQVKSQAISVGRLTEAGCYKISAEIFRDCIELGGDYRTCSFLSDQAADSCRILFPSKFTKD